ncbi:MAG: peptide chain release factor 1, partial [Solirubrobacteraceae bacterium]|nr:peptide chain release factor 1 [Solirubrobacteraceae bacterium]
MIEGLVDQIEQRHAELERLMGDPDVLGDRRRAAEVGREYHQMETAARLAAQWRHARSDEEGFKELLDVGEDVREVLDAARAERERLEEEIRL